MASRRVLGIDCSTKKLSWTIVKDGGVEAYDEIYFEGVNFVKRYKDVRQKVMAEVKKGTFDNIDYIGFEKAVMVRSADVALKLAGVFAISISCLGELDVKMVEIPPLTWQNAIGNPVLRGESKKKLLAANSQLKTKAAQQKFVREFRKQVTINYVEKRSGVVMPNDDLGDSAGIAYFLYDRLDDFEEKDEEA